MTTCLVGNRRRRCGSPEGFQLLLLPGVQDSDSKLDVSTRAAAGLYAMEHGLLPGGASQEMG